MENQSVFEDFAKQYDTKKFEPKKYEGGSLSSDDGFDYIAKLMFHPVADGRHRLTWKVLPTFAVNVLNLSDDDAFEMISTYLKACEMEEPTGARDRLMYYIQNARRTGYKPPRLETIRDDDPELFQLIVDAITDK